MFGKARAQAVYPQLFLIDDGHEEIGRDERDRSLKTGRCYADDGIRMLVEADRTANDPRIALEAGMPVGIGKHDIRSAVGPALIGCIGTSVPDRDESATRRSSCPWL